MKIFNMLKVKQFYKKENYPTFTVKFSDEEEYNQLIELLKKYDYGFFGEPYPFVNGEHKSTLKISTLQEIVTPSLDKEDWDSGGFEIINIGELKEILKKGVKKELEEETLNN